jgi:hypothetical protein
LSQARKHGSTQSHIGALQHRLRNHTLLRRGRSVNGHNAAGDNASLCLREKKDPEQRVHAVIPDGILYNPA